MGLSPRRARRYSSTRSVAGPAGAAFAAAGAAALAALFVLRQLPDDEPHDGEDHERDDDGGQVGREPLKH